MVESSAIGGVWIRTLNRADQVIAPNEFCRKVLEKYDVKTPITVIAPGVDTQTWSYIDRPYREIFTFGMCGYLDKRKGALEVIQAFCSEFTKEKDVRLILHSSNSDFGFYRSIHDPRITITTQFKTVEELWSFYGMLDCFVFPSRGEGIGYPPREAMSTGLPVIGMAWSGMEEIMLPEISYPIHPSGFSPRNDMVEQPGNWADIDVSELMYQIRWVYEHQKEAKQKGEKAACFIAENFSWKQSTDHMIQFLKSL
jgi:glycosyltransferase involved in cell wall biosynthesis